MMQGLSGVLVRENRVRAEPSLGRQRALEQQHRELLPKRPAFPMPPGSIDLTGTTMDFIALARAAADVRLALEEAAFAAEMSAAQARSVADALASFVISEDGFVPPASPRLPGPEAFLSLREQEVLALVAEGQTNKTIADALYISPNTVKSHVASLLHKLRAGSRVQLAAMATKLELDHFGAHGTSTPSVVSTGTLHSPSPITGE